MSSARQLFSELPESKKPRPATQPKKDKRDRQSRSGALLNEYARARRTISGNGDGFKFIWLNEFCPTDENAYDEEEKNTDLSQATARLRWPLSEHPEMRSLMISSWVIFAVLYIRLQLNYDFVAAGRLWNFMCTAYAAFELLVGTMFVEKDVWFVIEDKKAHSWLVHR